MQQSISDVVVKGRSKLHHPEANYELLRSLFMTITNANFDGDAIRDQISRMISLRDDTSRRMR